MHYITWTFTFHLDISLLLLLYFVFSSRSASSMCILNCSTTWICLWRKRHIAVRLDTQICILHTYMHKSYTYLHGCLLTSRCWYVKPEFYNRSAIGSLWGDRRHSTKENEEQISYEFKMKPTKKKRKTTDKQKTIGAYFAFIWAWELVSQHCHVSWQQ